jgi:hypothetical protein
MRSEFVDKLLAYSTPSYLFPPSAAGGFCSLGWQKVLSYTKMRCSRLCRAARTHTVCKKRFQRSGRNIMRRCATERKMTIRVPFAFCMHHALIQCAYFRYKITWVAISVVALLLGFAPRRPAVKDACGINFLWDVIGNFTKCTIAFFFHQVPHLMPIWSHSGSCT